MTTNEMDTLLAAIANLADVLRLEHESALVTAPMVDVASDQSFEAVAGWCMRNGTTE